MKAEHMEPFVSSAFKVLQILTGDVPRRGELKLRTNTFTSEQVTIMAGVNGDIEGISMYGMSRETAAKIAGAMIGCDVNELDEMAMSAISELGNMITGNATTLISQKGYNVDITPPSVIRGEMVQVCTRVPAIVVPMHTQFGKVEINVAIAENASAGSRAA